MKNLPATPNKSITVLLVVFLLAAFAITLTGCKANKSGLGDKDSSKTESAAEKKAREDLERARSEAKARLDQAYAALSELQGIGIDTSNLNEYINAAQFMCIYAETPEEYMGLTDSAAYWANVVINFSQEKKEAYLAALAEEEEGSNGEEDAGDYYREDKEEDPVTLMHDGQKYAEDEIHAIFHNYATERQIHEVVTRHGCTVAVLTKYEDIEGYEEYEDDWGVYVRLPESMTADDALCKFSQEPLVKKVDKVELYNNVP